MQYDVVIIGAGSAGCVLATRLTEDPQRSVLLLEVGPDYTDLERYPDDLKYGYDQTASAVDAPTTGPSWASPHPSKAPRCRCRAVGRSGAPAPLTGSVLARRPQDYDNWAALGDVHGPSARSSYFRKRAGHGHPG